MAFRADPMLGRTIAGYQIQATLGSGATSRIYRAVHTGGGAPVALKVLRAELAREPELVERFQREFANGSRIRHENVVALHTQGTTADGVHYQVQELMTGRPLYDLVDEAPLPLDRIARIGARIAAGLAAAHALGIVHRDLKPENVMVLPDDGVKLFDFGLARAAGMPDQPTLTGLDTRIGTPVFMAPEYIADGSIDHRVDLYALGVALYELATGGDPFHGQPFEILHKTVSEPAPRARTRVHDLDPRLDDLLAELLEKSPEARPASAAEVEARLLALLQSPPG